ncbi:v-type proton ATPase subunit a isoform 4 [Aphelenchoides avenae]|nr:v-type proton ATPase subunit a isoform 4 [Aphelenchus avenae]
MSFRSEPMKLLQMIVQKDAAYSCVVELGQQAMVQFKDLNSHVGVFQRTFVREVRRCTELERCIRYIESEVIAGGAKDHIPALDTSNIEVPQQRTIYELEAHLNELERDIRQFLENEARLKRNYNDLKEFQCVLQKVEAFFRVHIEHTAKTELENDGEEINDVGTPLTPLLEQHETPWFVAGIIDAKKQHSFERVLWRACRRTVFVRTTEIGKQFEDPDTGKLVSKSVFIIFFNGRKLQDIVNRVCEGFNAKQYACPKSSKERQLVEADVLLQLHDLSIVIASTAKHKLDILRNAAFELPEWVRQVHLQKAVFATLNLFTFDTSGNFFVAECWAPERELDTILQALYRGVEKSGSSIRPVVNVLETSHVPPTYNRTNKFTQVFQDIVDSYGIASYREVNPALFTIITFPFLFGVMFGDFGHGLIMVMAGLAFIKHEKKIQRMHIKDEIFNTFFGGRFIIVLMGFFSMYAGLLYNDVFSKSVNLFGSRWANPYNETQIQLWLTAQASTKTQVPTFDPAVAYLRDDGPYYVGVDPAWNLADNRLNFLNSMKMKASVIFGIAQMTFGVILSLLNARFFGSYADFFTTAIPQLIFLSCIFIYLCLQIIVKWLFYWVYPETVFGYYYPGSHCAPSLLIGLINMFMFRERKEGFMRPGMNRTHRHCHLAQWYPHQSMVERILVSIAIACVPIMLFGKPLCRMVFKGSGHNRKRSRSSNKAHNISVRVRLDTEEAELIAQEDTDNGAVKLRLDDDSGKTKAAKVHVGSQSSQHENMSFGDVMVHQSIHTIEFVLGCISHTASYLRLWALSLAHAQLSEVLWHMILAPAFTADGYLGALRLFVTFGVFFLMTVSILVLMEGLSAFLHALRLHWVEFQSKFYEGAGYIFVPFSLRNSLQKLCAGSDFY